MKKRSETRRERMDNKKPYAKTYENTEVCILNFMCEENVAFVIRAAACFGISTVNIIGSIPPHKELVRRSGTNQDNVVIKQYSNVHDFLEYTRKNNIILISAELDDEAKSIYDFKFPLDKRFCIVLGHELYGLTQDIWKESQHKVFIPCPGKGFNLNTSVAGSIIFHEIAKQHYEQENR